MNKKIHFNQIFITTYCLVISVTKKKNQFLVQAVANAILKKCAKFDLDRFTTLLKNLDLRLQKHSVEKIAIKVLKAVMV